MKYSNNIKKIEYELENNCSIFYIKDKGYILQFKYNGLYYIIDSDHNVYLSVGFWLHVQKDSRFTKYFKDDLEILIKYLINITYDQNALGEFTNKRFLKYSPETHLKVTEHIYIDYNNTYELQKMLYKLLI